MLRSCDIENCEETMVEKWEIKKREGTCRVTGAPNGVSYKNNTHTLGTSIHYFPKDVPVWPKWTRFDRCHREILLFKIVGLLLRLGFEDACYEHIPLV